MTLTHDSGLFIAALAGTAAAQAVGVQASIYKNNPVKHALAKPEVWAGAFAAAVAADVGLAMPLFIAQNNFNARRHGGGE